MISIALFNTEQEILKADPNNLGESNNHTQRMRHKNQVLEKFYAGQTDEKYVKDYYDILKKADLFMKNSTPHKIAVAGDKHGSNYGLKDIYGRRFEHLGFFDDKHKHAGKTLAEVLEMEIKERRTNDDDFELEYIFNNKPVEVGLVKALDYLEKTGNKISEPEVVGTYKSNGGIVEVIGDNVEYDELQVMNITKLSKQFDFPIKVFRDNNSVLNKIEQLTEFLHVKKIGFDSKRFEFFIPLKFKTETIEDGSIIFNELININSIFIKDAYGDLIAYRIDEYIKRIKYNDTHEVWKFRGIEMETMSNKN
jgi:hypothetical protein